MYVKQVDLLIKHTHKIKQRKNITDIPDFELMCNKANCNWIPFNGKENGLCLSLYGNKYSLTKL